MVNIKILLIELAAFVFSLAFAINICSASMPDFSVYPTNINTEIARSQMISHLITVTITEQYNTQQIYNKLEYENTTVPCCIVKAVNNSDEYFVWENMTVKVKENQKHYNLSCWVPANYAKNEIEMKLVFDNKNSSSAIPIKYSIKEENADTITFFDVKLPTDKSAKEIFASIIDQIVSFFKYLFWIN